MAFLACSLRAWAAEAPPCFAGAELLELDYSYWKLCGPAQQALGNCMPALAPDWA